MKNGAELLRDTNTWAESEGQHFRLFPPTLQQYRLPEGERVLRKLELLILNIW